MDFMRFLSKNGERSVLCVYFHLVRVTYSRARQDPQQAHVSLMLPPCPLHSVSGFPPIPGLEPRKGTEEDSVAATLATAQKLASEDTALVDEDEEVWLWAQDFRA